MRIFSTREIMGQDPVIFTVLGDRKSSIKIRSGISGRSLQGDYSKPI
ncbi:MAG: hypothetical protein AAFO95_06970 [Cyanobacteria bacterium J06600_6]